MYKRHNSQVFNRLCLAEIVKVRFQRTYCYNYILLPKVLFHYVWFFTVPSIFPEHLFLEHFCAIASISSTVKDAIVIIKITLKIVSFAYRTENHVHAKIL